MNSPKIGPLKNILPSYCFKYFRVTICGVSTEECGLAANIINQKCEL